MMKYWNYIFTIIELVCYSILCTLLGVKCNHFYNISKFSTCLHISMFSYQKGNHSWRYPISSMSHCFGWMSCFFAWPVILHFSATKPQFLSNIVFSKFAMFSWTNWRYIIPTCRFWTIKIKKQKQIWHDIAFMTGISVLVRHHLYTEMTPGICLRSRLVKNEITVELFHKQQILFYFFIQAYLGYSWISHYNESGRTSRYDSEFTNRGLPHIFHHNQH